MAKLGSKATGQRWDRGIVVAILVFLYKAIEFHASSLLYVGSLKQVRRGYRGAGSAKETGWQR